MVKEVVGDLLTCDADIICHQVNTYGVMGGGIAAAIRRKLLTQEQYAEYQRFCNDRHVLGKVQFIGNCIRKDGRSVILANVFSQEDMTTDYVAFDMCMGISAVALQVVTGIRLRVFFTVNFRICMIRLLLS